MTRRIAVLTPEGGGFFVGDVIRGIEAACQRRATQLLVIQTAASWQSAIFERPPIEDYVSLGSALRDGIVAVTGPTDAVQRSILASQGVPTVGVFGPAVTRDGRTVVVDNFGGARMAVRHLLEHGHRRIGFVGAFLQSDVVERHEGYCAALREAGIEPDPALCFAVNDDLFPGGTQAADLILDAGIPLTAIFSSTDTHAISLITRLAESGVRTPDDVAVIGFDDSELAQTAVPALTSVRQVPTALGAAAADGVLDAIDGLPTFEGRLELPVHLVVRHSCGCYESHRDMPEASYDWNAPDWQEQLAHLLVRALADVPAGAERPIDSNKVWPGVELIISAFDAAIRGLPTLNVTQLDEAWRTASSQTRHAETLMGLVDLLEFVGLCRQPHTGAGADSLRPRLRAYLEQSRLQILRYAAIADPLGDPQAPRITRHVVHSFVEAGGVGIGWLGHIDAQGCMALWDSAAAGEKSLRIVEGCGAAASAIRAGEVVPASQFPPVEWLDRLVATTASPTVIVAPLATRNRDWGVLAASLPSDHRYFDYYWAFQNGVDLLKMALERKAAGAR